MATNVKNLENISITSNVTSVNLNIDSLKIYSGNFYFVILLLKLILLGECLLMNSRLNKMVKIAVLSALAIVLMLLLRFPLIPSAPYMEYDPADIPVLIGGFMFGPISGLIITLIVSFIQAVSVSASSGWIGFVMHVIATGTYVLVSSFIYKRINELIKNIRRNGMLRGIGKPELLKHGLSGYCSRRINEEHRLIYAMDTNNNLVIVKCKGYYE
jgi:Txe/YoeB family toxin of toxin-antitoxin system